MMKKQNQYKPGSRHGAIGSEVHRRDRCKYQDDESEKNIQCTIHKQAYSSVISRYHCIASAQDNLEIKSFDHLGAGQST